MKIENNKDQKGFDWENLFANYFALGLYTFCLIAIYKTSPWLILYEAQGWKKYILLSFVFVVLIGAICGFIKAKPSEDTPFLFRRLFGIIKGVALAGFVYMIPALLITYAVN